MTKLDSFFRRSSSQDNDASNLNTGASVGTSSSVNIASEAGDRLHELTTQPSEACNIDIVAVLGLMDDPFRTWTKCRDKDGTPWIKDYLSLQLPRARIFSYGYDLCFVRSSCVAGIPEFAANLLAWLRLKRGSPQEKQRLILFMCHRLGSIIVKNVEIVLQATGLDCPLITTGSPHCAQQERGRPQKRPRYRLLRRSTRGLRHCAPGEVFCISTQDDDKKHEFGATVRFGESFQGLTNITNDAVHLICHLEILTFYETRNFPNLGIVVCRLCQCMKNQKLTKIYPIYC